MMITEGQSYLALGKAEGNCLNKTATFAVHRIALTLKYFYETILHIYHMNIAP
jgi:hypothetical protein